MELGFKLIPNFIDSASLLQMNGILRKFHQAWLVKNKEVYRKGAINSAYITNGEVLSASNRLDLLKFVSSQKLVSEAKRFLGDDIRFFYTQIFFNPLNELQKNYWHRDIQYTGQSEDEQRKTIEERRSQVIHLRLALADENGIELVPGSHFRWDSTEELNIRQSKNGKTVSDNIAGAEKVSLSRGDLLVFDANIIHRGIYGKERFSFDILFCKPFPEIMRFRSMTILPKNHELGYVECPEVFGNEEGV